MTKVLKGFGRNGEVEYPNTPEGLDALAESEGARMASVVFALAGNPDKIQMNERKLASLLQVTFRIGLRMGTGEGIKE